jgi:hypothetical protein
MSEPDVTLTDFALAILCGTFAVLAARWKTGRAWVVLFGSVGAGALLGGLVHGFFAEQGTRVHDVLWVLTLLAIGVTSAAMWFIGADIQLGARGARLVRQAAIAALLAYAWIVAFVDSHFYVAIAAYLPATVFLIVALVLFYRRAPSRALLLGILGLALTFVAAAVQQLRIAIHPVWFNHNALYHVIQGAALALLFVGARALTATPHILRSAE